MDYVIMIDDLSEQELLETAMVVFNINQVTQKPEETDKKLAVTHVSLRADYRNPENPYWVALWPSLTHIDGMTEDEIDGRNVMLNWSEESVLERLSKMGVLSYTTRSVRVEDIYETGRAGDMPESYAIHLSADKYTNFSTQIINAAKNQITIPAQLKFSNFSSPLVIVDGKNYKLRAMRNGIAYDIIMYCYEKHPDTVVTLKTLIHELSLEDVSNISETMRNSVFDNNKGLLRSFVVMSPQFIKISRSIELPILQFEDIVVAGKSAKKSE